MAQKRRLKKWVKIPLIVLVTIGVGYFTYLMVLSIIFKPRDVRITNITSGSATISWVTDSPRTGSVSYKEGETFVPLFTGIGSEEAYDDRDWHNAQMECVNDLNAIADESKDENFSVNGDNYDCNEFTVEQKGEYYVHHVVLRGLDSEKTYNFRVGDGLLKWKAKGLDKEVVSSFDTYAQVSSVSEPIPIFGRVVSESGEYSNDSLVYIQFGKSGEELIESILYSAVTNEDGGWYMDGGNIRGLDGEAYQLVSGDDGMILQGIYKNTEKSQSENFVFGYFDGAYPDIETSAALAISDSMFVQQVYAGCSYSSRNDPNVCTVEELKKHPEFGAGNVAKAIAAQTGGVINEEVLKAAGLGGNTAANLSAITGQGIREEDPRNNGTLSVKVNTNDYGYHSIDPGGDDGPYNYVPTNNNSVTTTEKKEEEGSSTSGITVTIDEDNKEVWKFAGEKIDVKATWLHDDVKDEIDILRKECENNGDIKCGEINIEPFEINLIALVEDNISIQDCLKKNNCKVDGFRETYIETIVTIKREKEANLLTQQGDSTFASTLWDSLGTQTESITTGDEVLSVNDDGTVDVNLENLDQETFDVIWNDASSDDKNQILKDILPAKVYEYWLTPVTTELGRTRINIDNIELILRDGFLTIPDTTIDQNIKGDNQFTFPPELYERISDFNLPNVVTEEIIKTTKLSEISNNEFQSLWDKATKSEKESILRSIGGDNVNSLISTGVENIETINITSQFIDIPGTSPIKIIEGDIEIVTEKTIIASLDAPNISGVPVITQEILKQVANNSDQPLLTNLNLDEKCVNTDSGCSMDKIAVIIERWNDPTSWTEVRNGNADLFEGIPMSELIVEKVGEDEYIIRVKNQNESSLTLEQEIDELDQLIDDMDISAEVESGTVKIKEDDERSSIFNFRDLISKSYAQDATSQELISSKDAGYTFFLPEYGMFSLSFGQHEFAKDVSDGNNIYVFYLDVNGEEGFQPPVDADNPTAYEDMVLKSDAFKIEYEQIAVVREYDFKAGINIVSFDFIPVSEEEDAFSARDFVKTAEENGVNVEYITYFEDGRWLDGFKCIEDACTGRNFTILPGKGYLVKTTEGGSVPIGAYNLLSPVPVPLNSGWNLSALHGYDQVYTAKTFMDSANEIEGLIVDNVTYYDTGKSRYEGLQYTGGNEYGYDFPIDPQLGYFFRVVELEPEDEACKTIIWHEGADLHGKCGSSKSIF